MTPRRIETNELLTVKDLARKLALSPRTIWRLRDTGGLPAPVKIGAAVRWRASDIDQFIADDCRAIRGVAGNARAGRQPVFFNRFARCDDQGRGAIIHARGIACGDAAALAKGGA